MDQKQLGQAKRIKADFSSSGSKKKVCASKI